MCVCVIYNLPFENNQKNEIKQNLFHVSGAILLLSLFWCVCFTELLPTLLVLGLEARERFYCSAMGTG